MRRGRRHDGAALGGPAGRCGRGGDAPRSGALIPQRTTRYGVTPLSLAALNGNAAVIATLLEARADVQCRLSGRRNAADGGGSERKSDAVRLLLPHGAEVNTKESWKKQSALMWAAGEGHTEAIEASSRTAALSSTRSKGGFTPLFFAVRRASRGQAGLIESGGKPNDVVEFRPSRPENASSQEERIRHHPAACRRR